jgi:hypothetical protein
MFTSWGRSLLLKLPNNRTGKRAGTNSCRRSGATGHTSLVLVMTHGHDPVTKVVETEGDLDLFVRSLLDSNLGK